tara:strand:- start:1917 stop:2297 length:381 start_codon:yes stop_codon:yes gene_type:complete
VILRDIDPYFFDFDFVGAVCGNLDEETFVINGGLSLRRTRVMQEICINLSEDEKKQTEDILFTDKVRERYNLPTIEDCYKFSLESIGNQETILGIHGTDKYYCDLSFVNFSKTLNKFWKSFCFLYK